MVINNNNNNDDGMCSVKRKARPILIIIMFQESSKIVRYSETVQKLRIDHLRSVVRKPNGAQVVKDFLKDKYPSTATYVRLIRSESTTQGFLYFLHVATNNTKKTVIKINPGSSWKGSR